MGKLVGLLGVTSALLFAVASGSIPCARADILWNPPNSTETKSVMTIRLREVLSEPEPVARPETSEGEPLSARRVKALLERLPDRTTREAPPEFFRRESSPPPPLSGETVDVAFPPLDVPQAPLTTPEGPLEIVRFAPEGEVDLAPRLSITFSQPMVAISAQDEAAARAPVEISPRPPGQWRWLGSRTLVYEPKGRFPMATEFAVEIPQGLASKTGARLAATQRFAFQTPAPKLVERHPVGTTSLRPVIFLGFDQQIDEERMLRFVSLSSGGYTALRRASEAEIDAEEPVRRLRDNARSGHWLALVPKRPLAADTDYRLKVAPRAPSAEGPRVTALAQEMNFRTFAPLRVTKVRCFHDSCVPGNSWFIEFNNALAAVDDPPIVKVEPALPEFEVGIVNKFIYISGRAKGRTRYNVTLPASLRDVYGQELGDAVPLEIQIGEAPRVLYGPTDKMVTLNPEADPALSIFSRNHEYLKVRISRVDPSHWDDWYAWTHQSPQNVPNNAPLPGESLFDDRIRIEGEPDALIETAIDLSPYLEGGYGQFLVIVDPEEHLEEQRPRINTWVRNRRVAVWVQVTDLGLTAFTDQTELVVWVTELTDGRAAPDVELSLEPGRVTRSGADGLARMSVGAIGTSAPLFLVARRGRDLAILNEGLQHWRKRDGGLALSWFTFDDRGIYRPGESVRVKGWLRVLDRSKGGDLTDFDGNVSPLHWSLQGPLGDKLASGKTELSALGGFDIAFDLPSDMNLGFAALSIRTATQADGERLLGASASHRIRVEEFRRPQFEVETRVSAGPFFAGGEAELALKARYYSGGPLSSAPVDWSVETSAARYSPPNRGDYHFGVWRPWWRRIDRSQSSRSVAKLEGKTDLVGRHGLAIDFAPSDLPQPVAVTVTGSITDVNRQKLSSSENLLVHPAMRYVGLRMPRGFVGLGDEVELDGIVVDIDGAADRAVPVEVRMARMKKAFVAGELKPTEVDAIHCRAKSKASGTFSCLFKPKVGGSYRLIANVEDEDQRRNETSLHFWVVGGEGLPSRGLELEEVLLVPEKQNYQPGDIASILVQAPFHPAEGVLTVQRSGLVRTERFSMTGPSHTLHIPIEEGHIPNVMVQVDLLGSALRRDEAGDPIADAPARVAYGRGHLRFAVPPLARTLKVEATPSSELLLPGSDGTVDLYVVDADGEPVAGAEVAVVVVDEAVLALTDYALPDPMAFFYAPRHGGVRTYDQRAHVVTTRSMERREVRREAAFSAPNLMARSGWQQGVARLKPRSDFRALAAFAPRVMTDAHGRAVADFTLPDSLTRYRVLAVAAAGSQRFGAGESTLTARLPLMVRPSPPRFLNFGDRFELSLVVQNLSDRGRSVDVAVRGEGIALGGEARLLGKRVSVPAGDRREVRFAAKATSVGTASFQAIAASDLHEDAIAFSLPVYTPATSEAFATYGDLEGGAVTQPVRVPEDIWTQFGGLEVETSSTQLQALTDAFIYLIKYPFECGEQLASRILAIAALRDVLTAFDSESLPPAAELEASVAAMLATLVQRQNGDGGFGFWRRDNESNPFTSLHVAHALARAKINGFEVDDRLWNRAFVYLGNLEQIADLDYSERSNYMLRAYALYISRLTGLIEGEKAHALYQSAGLEGLSIESLGFLLPVLHDAGHKTDVDEILRHLGNRVTETASGAHFVSRYSDGEYVLLHSSRRADGVLLEALLAVSPNNDLIEKLVRGLLDHRLKGRWSNTQENAFILLALDGYFDARESVTPDFLSRVWLGDRFAGEHRFEGRTTERARIEVPMAALEGHGEQDLVLAKEGQGRLYYRIGMRYAPKSLQLEATENGFTVERKYEAVDDDADVSRDEDGTWHIRAGTRVRVQLLLATPTRRYHVALVDSLPAGLEPLNPDLAISMEPVDEDEHRAGPTSRGWGRSRAWRWFEHQNLRDERVEAFASRLYAGVYEYTYLARATALGSFVTPPTRVEEMYHPETFGRSATDRVIVE